MTTFIQMHLLTAYPPANLNRDDMGRPKTCAVGGVERLRVSSQSLKRAWRTSELWEQALAGNLGVRTKEMGVFVYKALAEGAALEDLVYERSGGKSLPTVKDKLARETAKAIAEVFGKLDSAKPDKAADKDAAPDDPAQAQDAVQKNDPLRELRLKQLAHFAPEEVAAIAALTEQVRARGKAPEKDALQLLRTNLRAADIALFGRMLADEPAFNVEAACQVGHAFSVERVAVEDDFFTAVDDLNRDDMGAGHMGVTEFGSGVFYLYACIDKDLLTNNLGGDAALAARALRALVQAMATVAPTGKQNSFASRAYASFILAEKGQDQPRSLTAAFVKPMAGQNVLEDAVKALLATRDKMNAVYNLETLDCRTLNALAGEGSLREILDFTAGD